MDCSASGDAIIWLPGSGKKSRSRKVPWSDLQDVSNVNSIVSLGRLTCLTQYSSGEPFSCPSTASGWKGPEDARAVILQPIPGGPMIRMLTYHTHVCYRGRKFLVMMARRANDIANIGRELWLREPGFDDPAKGGCQKNWVPFEYKGLCPALCLHTIHSALLVYSV